MKTLPSSIYQHINKVADIINIKPKPQRLSLGFLCSYLLVLATERAFVALKLGREEIIGGEFDAAENVAGLVS